MTFILSAAAWAGAIQVADRLVTRRSFYILHSPFSQQKMTYRKDTKTGLYRSKMNPNLKRNFTLFPVLDWIAEITTPSVVKIIFGSFQINSWMFPIGGRSGGLHQAAAFVSNDP